MRISESELGRKWYYTIIVQETSEETPTYTVRIRTEGIDKTVPLRIDGVESSVWTVKVEIGKGLHAFEVPKEVLKEENQTTRIE